MLRDSAATFPRASLRFFSKRSYLGADEKVLRFLAAAVWLGVARPLRRTGNHALLVTVAYRTV